MSTRPDPNPQAEPGTVIGSIEPPIPVYEIHPSEPAPADIQNTGVVYNPPGRVRRWIQGFRAFQQSPREFEDRNTPTTTMTFRRTPDKFAAVTVDFEQTEVAEIARRVPCNPC